MSWDEDCEVLPPPELRKDAGKVAGVLRDRHQTMITHGITPKLNRLAGGREALDCETDVIAIAAFIVPTNNLSQ